MPKDLNYQAVLDWTGGQRGPAVTYADYDRTYTVTFEGKPPLLCSADPNFRGDPALQSPEDQLLAALAGCHLLTYLALCVRKGLQVQGYSDQPTGRMTFEGSTYHFAEVVLRPRVQLLAGDPALALALHAEAHTGCFIARSVNFPVRIEAEVLA